MVGVVSNSPMEYKNPSLLLRIENFGPMITVLLLKAVLSDA